jgi:hypothetical protein
MPSLWIFCYGRAIAAAWLEIRNAVELELNSFHALVLAFDQCSSF